MHIILNDFDRVENGKTPYLLLFYYFCKPKTMEYITDQFSSFADFFLSVGLGIGRTDTPEKTNRKSMSNERTFSPTGDETLLHQKLGNRQMVIQICLVTQCLTHTIHSL